MRVALLLFALFLLVSSVQITKVTSVLPGNIRKYTVVGDPTLASPNGIAAWGVNYAWSKQGNQSAQAALDAAKFAFATPALSAGQDLSFYFGFLDVNAKVNFTASTASISGALGEVAASIYSIFVWYEGNGQPGFQYSLGENVWDCTPGPLDCVDTSLVISLQSLTWSPIQYNNYSCPDPTIYAPDCQVYVFSTTGSSGANQVIQFALKLASQPVFIDAVEVTPDYGKIDITISYPWSTTNAKANANVGLIGAAAGKAVSGSAQIAQIDNRNAIVFAGTGAHAYFSWDGTAQVDTSSGTVYVQTISGQDIINYNCSLLCGPVITSLKLEAAVLKALGWQTELVIFTWAQNQPGSVVWDPVMGKADSGANIGSASLAFVAGSLVTLVISALF